MNSFSASPFNAGLFSIFQLLFAIEKFLPDAYIQSMNLGISHLGYIRWHLSMQVVPGGIPPLQPEAGWNQAT